MATEIIQVEVAYALPEQQWVLVVDLTQPATVAYALDAVAGLEPFAGLDLGTMPVGVFGEVVERSQQLQALDRVELYRSLHQDPKTARRLRAQRAGS